MACKITKSKGSIACKDVVSGIRNIFLINYDDAYPLATSDPFIELGSSQVITALDATLFPLSAPGPTGKVFQYAVKNTGDSLQQTIASSRDTGTTSFTQVLTFILTRLSAEMEYELKVMAWGRPILVAELNTGQFVMIGKKNGAEITGTNGVGGAIDSLNGYTMTATGTEPEPFWYLADAARDRLLQNTNTTTISEDTPFITSATGSFLVDMPATLVLTGSGTPRATNTWISGEPTIATVTGTGLNAGTVTGVSAGVATMYYTNSAGNTVSVDVTVIT